MSNPVASADDLQARALRPLTDVELTVAQQWLDDAWTILVTERPFLASAVTTSTNLRSLTSQIVCSMVMRCYNNPNGVYIEAIDDYSYTRDQAVSSGSLYVSPDELALIGFNDGAGGAFTIRQPANPWPYVYGGYQADMDWSSGGGLLL